MPYKLLKNKDNTYNVINTKSKALKQMNLLNKLHNYSVYGGKLKVSDIKHFLKKSYDKNLENHNDYNVDKDLSGTRVQVYHNPNLNHTVVVHKGTDSIHDWITDLRMGLGNKNTKRFQHSKNIQNQAENKYTNSKISTLGHSLGSKLAEESNKNDNNEIITLNNPTLLSDLVKKKKKNQYDIRTKLDPVSILKNFVPKNKNDVTIKSDSYNPLIEHSTDTLDRINQDLEIGKGIPISYMTYKQFAKKYKIKLSKNKIKKSLKQLSDEIYDFEKMNKITDGLYF